ncbi:MAG: hypothetical protein ACPGLV_01680 [Bacteroidia bacterium]
MKWILFLSVILLSACTQNFESEISVKNPTKDADCQGVSCTMDYRIISIHLKDKNGDLIYLEEGEYKVYFTESGEELELTNRMLFSDLSRYEIANDGLMSKFDYAGTSITFEANLSKFKTWKREFIIAKDCCHIYSPDEQQLEFEL